MEVRVFSWAPALFLSPFLLLSAAPPFGTIPSPARRPLPWAPSPLLGAIPSPGHHPLSCAPPLSWAPSLLLHAVFSPGRHRLRLRTSHVAVQGWPCRGRAPPPFSPGAGKAAPNRRLGFAWDRFPAVRSGGRAIGQRALGNRRGVRKASASATGRAPEAPGAGVPVPCRTAALARPAIPATSRGDDHTLRPGRNHPPAPP